MLLYFWCPEMVYDRRIMILFVLVFILQFFGYAAGHTIRWENNISAFGCCPDVSVSSGSDRLVFDVDFPIVKTPKIPDIDIEVRMIDFLPDSPPVPDVPDVDFFVSGNVFGNIVVDDVMVIENDVLYVYGDIIVMGGAVLRVINSTIVICSSYDGQFGIDVMSGGSLYLNRSRVMPLRMYANYYFRVHSGSFVSVYRSEIMYSGFSWGYSGSLSGLWINHSRFEIYDSSFVGNWAGLILLGADGILRNTTFVGGYYGIVLIGVENMRVENISLVDAWYGLRVEFSSNIEIVDVVSVNNIFGLYCYYSSNVSVSGFHANNSTYGAVIWRSKSMVVDASDISDGYIGLIVHNSYDVSIDDTDIANSSFSGVVVHSSADVRFSSDRIGTNIYGVIVFSSANISLSSSNINGNMAYGVLFCHSQNIDVSFSIFSNNSEGIIFSESLGANIYFSLFIGNERSIFVSESRSIGIYLCGFLSAGRTIYVANSTDVSISYVLVWNTRKEYTVSGTSFIFSENITLNWVMLFNDPLLVYDTSLSRLMTLDFSNVYLDLSPVLLLKNENSATISGFSQAILINCSNIDIVGPSNIYGLYMFYSDNITVSDLRIEKNYYGVLLFESSGIVAEKLDVEYCYTAFFAQNVINVSISDTHISMSNNGIFAENIHNVYLNNISISNASDVGIIADCVDFLYIRDLNASNVSTVLSIADCDNVYVANVAAYNSSTGIAINNTVEVSIVNITYINVDVGIYASSVGEFFCEKINATRSKYFLYLRYVDLCVLTDLWATNSSYFLVILDGYDITLSDLYCYNTENSTMILNAGSLNASNISILDGEYGIYLNNCSGELSDIHIYNMSVGGFTAYYCNLSLREIHIFDSQYGLYADTGGLLEIYGFWAENISSETISTVDVEHVCLYNATLRNTTGPALWLVDTVSVENISITDSPLGLYLSNTSDISIENINISDADVGIYLIFAGDGYAENIFVSNATNAIIILETHTISVSQLVAKNCYSAIETKNTYKVELHECIVDSYDGISLISTSRLDIRRSEIIADNKGIVAFSTTKILIKKTIISSNMSIAINKSREVKIYQSTINNSNYGLILIDTHHSDIRNCDISNCETSIISEEVGHISIKFTNIERPTLSNNTGIYIRNARKTVIEKSNIYNYSTAILINRSQETRIATTRTEFSNNSIIITNSEQITINKVTICGKENLGNNGILIQNSNNIEIVQTNCLNLSEGIYLSNVSDAIIAHNQIKQCSDTGISIIDSKNILLRMNNIAYNYRGLIVDPKDGYNDTIIVYLNNFINNTIQAYDTEKIIWNKIAGNYWEPNNDNEDKDKNNISETPYRIDSDSYDYRPLLLPYNQFDTTPPKITGMYYYGIYGSMTITMPDLIYGFDLRIRIKETSEITKIQVSYQIKEESGETKTITETPTYEYSSNFTHTYTMRIIPLKNPAIKLQNMSELQIEIHVSDIFNHKTTKQYKIPIISINIAAKGKKREIPIGKPPEIEFPKEIEEETKTKTIQPTQQILLSPIAIPIIITTNKKTGHKK